MLLHDAIGIDPDSLACVATLVRRNGYALVSQRFPLTLKGRLQLEQFIRSSGNVLVGIEGQRGQSRPLENFFDEKGISFFSLPAVKIANYRRAMVGGNKNNQNDSRAVAEFLIDLESKSQLDDYRVDYRVDQELQMLARRRHSIGQQITGQVSVLWKLLKDIAPDLYLALKGGGEEVSAKFKLTAKRVLSLFLSRTQLGSWQELSESDLLELVGQKRRGWETFVTMVQSVAKVTAAIGPAAVITLRQVVEILIKLLDQEDELESALAREVSQRPLATALVARYKGMGNFLAGLLVAEIITIERFRNDDHLASYAGLTKRDFSTGTNDRQIHSAACNTRLKFAFIGLARCYLVSNKGSHIDRYHSKLIARGMSPLEALKRVARALVREVYRFMKTWKPEPAAGSSETKKESSVAIDSNTRQSLGSTSNTKLPTSSLIHRKWPVKTEVKLLI